MIHPHTELRFINDVIGYGLVATRPIPAGTITWALDALDQRLSPAFAATLAPATKAMVDRYSFVVETGDHILCWDHARYMNHSCEATCLAPGFAFEIAVRDIAAGEELTDDYGSLNVDESFQCECGAATCRGVVTPGDWDALHAQWDARIRAAFPLIGSVEQPLWNLIADTAAIRAASLDHARIPSITQHRYAPPQAARAQAG